MGKRSQRRLSRHERDQAGCMQGLISIFDFRHSPATKKLLLDKRQDSKQAVGAEYLSTKTVLPDPAASPQNVADDEEYKTPLIDSAKISVKELMEEEMSNEQVPMNQSTETDVSYEQIDTKHEHQSKKNSKKKNRIWNKSSDMDAAELEKFLKVLEQRTLDNLDLQTIIKELAHINQRSTNFEKHCFRADAETVIEEKIVAAVEVFKENSVSNNKHFGEEGKSHCLKELMYALQSSSNKGLLLELLQDPNSILVKQIQNLEDFQLKEELTLCSLPESGLLEKKPKSDEMSSRKHHSLFRRRSKSLESLPIGRDTISHSSNKIVILKPGPGGAHKSVTNVTTTRMSLQSDSNERNASQFSFSEIKRKLRHAMGMERHVISHEELILVSPRHQNMNNGDKSANGETLGWSSPNRNHFYTERFAKSVIRSKDNGSAMINGNSNIYIEAKKHLSEILNNGETAESMMGNMQKPLGRILSFPEYGSSTFSSPREKDDEIFITAQMRLSPRGMAKNNIVGNHPSPSRKSLETRPRISCSNSNDEIQPPNAIADSPSTNDQACCLIENSVTSEAVQRLFNIKEITKPKPREEEKIITETLESKEENIINISSELCGDSVALDIRNVEVREMDNEEITSQCFEDSPQCIKSDLMQEEQISSSQTISPSCSPVSKKVEDSDCAVDHVERPSPISVLDPLFTEDDVSPTSTKSLSVEKEIQPRHIHFDEQFHANEQETCIRISLEDNETSFEYVEAVLLGSGLNWKEFLLRWLSFQEILDLSLFDEVELFSSRSHHDQKFLFDCANQALMEVCEIHFGCFTGISHVKNICPVPKGMDFIHEIWRRVEWQLVQNPQCHSLDQLMKIDMAGCSTWKILKSDIELIGLGMEDSIFDELMEDIVSSFVDDTLGYEFQVLAECGATEDAK